MIALPVDQLALGAALVFLVGLIVGSRVRRPAPVVPPPALTMDQARYDQLRKNTAYWEREFAEGRVDADTPRWLLKDMQTAVGRR